jgi:hypothetical protein
MAAILGAVNDAPRLGPPIRFDPFGVALMVAALGFGLLGRGLLPDADACGPAPVGALALFALSVVAFTFGFVRCLEGRARRWGLAAGVIVMVAVTAGSIALALWSANVAAAPDCG